MIVTILHIHSAKYCWSIDPLSISFFLINNFDTYTIVHGQQDHWELDSASTSSTAKSVGAANFTSESHQPTIFGNLSPSLTPTPTASPPLPILSVLPLTLTPFVPSQATLTWGMMMMPDEVRELLTLQPQFGEYYVILKGHRPGVYLSW